jgi:hypothetical protein
MRFYFGVSAAGCSAAGTSIAGASVVAGASIGATAGCSVTGSDFWQPPTKKEAITTNDNISLWNVDMISP